MLNIRRSKGTGCVEAIILVIIFFVICGFSNMYFSSKVKWRWIPSSKTLYVNCIFSSSTNEHILRNIRRISKPGKDIFKQPSAQFFLCKLFFDASDENFDKSKYQRLLLLSIFFCFFLDFLTVCQMFCDGFT